MRNGYRTLRLRSQASTTKNKDFWDKASTLTVPFVSLVLGSWGAYATYTYNEASLRQQAWQAVLEREQHKADARADRKQRQAQADNARMLADADQLQKLFLFISSSDPQKRTFGYSMFEALGHRDLALSLIKLNADKAGLALVRRAQSDPRPDVRAEAEGALKLFRDVKGGVYSLGTVTPRAIAAGNSAVTSDLSNAMKRIVLAVVDNEGRLDSVQTYDATYLSFGILQWNLGLQDSPGNLAAFLVQLKREAPDAFRRYFGRYGLDAQLVANPSGESRAGYLRLNGRLLRDGPSKEVMRDRAWAERFAAAGRDPEVQRVEFSSVAGAVGRVAGLFVHDRRVSEWLTSEYGMAQVVDEYLNRPGHVPGTLARALDKSLPALGKPDPGTWTARDEAVLVDAYVLERRDTNMTNSEQRANRIRDLAAKGGISTARKSFLAG